MMNNTDAVKWLDMKFIVPKELKQLCEYCYQFEKLSQHLRLVAPVYTGEDMGYVLELIEMIISEYFKILRNNKKEEDIKEIRQDIQQLLSLIYGTPGRKVTKVSAIELIKMRDEFDIYVPIFLSHFRKFVEGRIYSSLEESKNKAESAFKTFFVQSTSMKAGIYPREEEEMPNIVREEDME